MTRKIGIISDTHLSGNDNDFREAVSLAFPDCDTVIHAGDLTELGVLDALKPREVLAVHGNMCTRATKNALPEYLLADIEGYRIAVCHGAGAGYDIEGGLYSRFPEADCIIYGHTHRQSKSSFGSTLVVNPGSFLGGAYAILEIDKDGFTVHLRQLNRQP